MINIKTLEISTHLFIYLFFYFKSDQTEPAPELFEEPSFS